MKNKLLTITLLVTGLGLKASDNTTKARDDHGSSSKTIHEKTLNKDDMEKTFDFYYVDCSETCGTDYVVQITKGQKLTVEYKERATQVDYDRYLTLQQQIADETAIDEFWGDY